MAEGGPEIGASDVLVRRLYEQRFTVEEVRKLFRVLDWMMHLEEEQAIIFRTELEQLEAEKGMQYVTSIERLAKKEGRQEGSIAILGAQLAQRFGALPDWAIRKLQAASSETLEAWGRRIFDARSLDEIFA